MNNEIPKLYTETRETIKAELEGSVFLIVQQTSGPAEQCSPTWLYLLSS